jgi:hypothetical protein
MVRRMLGTSRERKKERKGRAKKLANEELLDTVT